MLKYYQYLWKEQQAIDDAEHRWDKASVHTFRGTYGEYLLKKVSRVFPDLAQEQTIIEPNSY